MNSGVLPQRFVAYFRVSTNKQGQSGLGLEGVTTRTVRSCTTQKNQ